MITRKMGKNKLLKYKSLIFLNLKIIKKKVAQKFNHITKEIEVYIKSDKIYW